MRKYDYCEIALSGPSNGNPFREVSLQATFTCNGTSVTVPGFYDGDGIYRIRFLPLQEGHWNYRTVSNAPEMDQQTGVLEIQPAREGRHGPVRVHNTYSFAYDDGTPFIPFGTTAYAWAVQDRETVEQTFESLRQAPFNKIRMSALPKHYLHNFNEPCGYLFEGGILDPEAPVPPAFIGMEGKNYRFDFSRPNTKFFQYFDTILQRLDEMGIQADLILFHNYDRWGFSCMSQEDNLAYVRYMVARYAAYPNVWWSMANEWDLCRGWTEDMWMELTLAVAHEDPFGHMLGIHNASKIFHPELPEITHLSLQRMFSFDVEKTKELRTQYHKPVVWDEVCYEGNIEESFGNIPGEELVRKFWEAYLCGGYCTHGECYDNPSDTIFWGKGGTLVGTSPARIAFLRDIIESAPGPIEPFRGFMLGGIIGVAGETFERNCNPFPQDENAPFGRLPGNYGPWMMFYLGLTQSNRMTLILPEDKQYRLDIIDTWNMTITELPGLYSGRFSLPLPGKVYTAIRARLVN